MTDKTLLCLPITIFAPEVDDHVGRNAVRAAAAIRRGAAEGAAMILLPLHLLTAGGPPLAAWPGGNALAALQAAAREAAVWVAAADRFADGAVAFLIDPAGGLALVQPALEDAQALGDDAVAETPLGRVALLVGDEAGHPEYARMLAYRGAELLLNPTAERRDEGFAARADMRGSRSWENYAWTATASLAGIVDDGGLRIDTGAGVAEIWDHRALPIARAEGGDPASAEVDLAALRRRRLGKPVNFFGMLRSNLYADVFARGERMPAPAGDPPPPYEALIAQTHQIFLDDLADRDAVIGANLAHAIATAKVMAMAPNVRLIVFPEFFLQGSPFMRPLDYWERAGIRVPGPEIEALAGLARATSCFVSGAVLEYDPDWPRRYFNTAFILSPQGELILRYRKLQCADLTGMLGVTTPGSVHRDYVARYGAEALIPVVETEIGRLGALICFDNNWPELWRGLALAGAEVICNPTSEASTDRRDPWDQAKRAHAAEQMVYVCSSNAASEQFTPAAGTTTMNCGRSALIDHHGRYVARLAGTGVTPLTATIDIGALRAARAARRGPRFNRMLAAEGYRTMPGFPLDSFVDKPMEQQHEGLALSTAHVERLAAEGILRRA